MAELPELDPGFRFLTDDEQIGMGDKYWYREDVGWILLEGLIYMGASVKNCRDWMRPWWDGPFYFATNREPDPEPIVIGKLLEGLQ